MPVESLWLSRLDARDRARLRPVPSSPPAAVDVLVVGGGLVGLWIAWYLSHRGAGRVMVVDAGSIGGGASSANAGGLFAGQLRFDFPEPFRQLAVDSRELYAEQVDDGPLDRRDIEFRRNGSLAIVADWPDSPAEYASRETRCGRRADWLEAASLADIEPAISSSFSHGLFCPDDATLDPVRTTLALVESLDDVGVVLASGVSVDELLVSGGRVEAAVTPGGRIAAGSVVLASGWSTPRLAGGLGLTLPVQPAKGQMIATAPMSPVLRTNILGDHMIRQLPSGEIIAGGTIEFVGPDLEPTRLAQDEVLEAVHRTLPGLADATVESTWVGLRPHTPDEMPVIDRVPGIGNAWIAAGHFTKGLLLAPVTGQMIAEWIVDGQPSRDIGYLGWNRFAG